MQHSLTTAKWQSQAVASVAESSSDRRCACKWRDREVRNAIAAPASSGACDLTFEVRRLRAAVRVERVDAGAHERLAHLRKACSGAS
eukprot:5189734-Pleurochrysis_carterae.AAC.2